MAVSLVGAVAPVGTGVQDAISKGVTFQQFQKDLKPLLQKKGWWGIKEMIDPKTGKKKQVQLGSPRRLNTIYDVNVRQARGVEVWENAQRNKKVTPYFKYLIGPSLEHRQEHTQWHNLVLPVDDLFWDTHFAPNGYGCKCHMVAITKFDYAKNQHKYQTKTPKIEHKEFINKRTGEIMRVPKGIDPGFDFNAGKQKRQWDKYGHLPDCGGIALNSFNKKACAKKAIKIRGDGNWKSYGLLSAGDVPDKLKLPMLMFLKSKDDLRKALLGKEKQRIIKTPVEDVIIDGAIVDYLKSHDNDDNRWRYANFIIPTLKQPNEIWLSRYSDGSIRPNYISFFKGDKPRNFVVIVKIAKDGQLVYNAIPKSKFKNINRSRDGILYYTKK